MIAHPARRPAVRPASKSAGTRHRRARPCVIAEPRRQLPQLAPELAAGGEPLERALAVRARLPGDRSARTCSRSARSSSRKDFRRPASHWNDRATIGSAPRFKRFVRNRRYARSRDESGRPPGSCIDTRCPATSPGPRRRTWATCLPHRSARTPARPLRERRTHPLGRPGEQTAAILILRTTPTLHSSGRAVPT